MGDTRAREGVWGFAGVLLLGLTALGCAAEPSGGDDEGGGAQPPVTPPATGSIGGTGAGGAIGSGAAGVGVGAAGTVASAGGSGGASAPPIGGAAAPLAGTGAVAEAGAGAAGMTGGTGGMPAAPPGAEDGDPSMPVVTTPEVACGGPSGGFGLGSANFQMDGRDVIVTYPCEKHAGAPMTFFLNLHGTTPVAQHFYQHGYFKVHQFAASHNIITVTPSSVVQQWGNGDDGKDLPHLMNLINWVYTTFDGAGKFDIRAMWVGGHSWGAMYTTTFACRDELADKIKGAVIMSGIGTNPACASRLSVISTAAEDDIGPVVNQGMVPMTHGCDASMESMLGNNTETAWPNCDPGFAHANYFMLGKTHTSSIDVEVVERIADQIKATRQ